MTLAQPRSWLLGIALLSLLASQPAFAVSPPSPTYVMFYGGQLASPVVLEIDPTSHSSFLWASFGRRDGILQRETIARRLEGRTYLNFAVFWGQWTDRPLKPEEASQHGRLYPPTATEPAVVVATFPAMQAADPDLRTPPAQPIPVDLEVHLDAGGHRIGFWAGWVLTSEEIAAAKRLGVPRL